jgi:adenosylcobinamide-GDP ribazoletransferase
VTQSSRPWPNAVRLALGTLTSIPVRPPTTVNRTVAGRAMMLAPAVGLLLGFGAALILFAGRELFHDARLAAAITVAALALATRGLHLDGLADTADGLGASAHGRQRALEVMRRGDVGPFGVATVALVLLIQVLALGSAVLQGYGSLAAVLACVVGRLAATLACTRGIPAARLDGLGAAVAGSVNRTIAVALVLVVAALAAVGGGLLDDDADLQNGILAIVAVAGGLLLAGLLLLRCYRRLGGITGDVLGAVVELAALGTLVVFAL